MQHNHSHTHEHGYGHGHGGGAGHNSGTSVTQWQTPHVPESTRQTSSDPEPDLDLVENAFVEAFSRAPDPTSFLRLAGVPFVGSSADGRKCCLLRVEISRNTDIGSLSPYLGGGGHRYDPLPAGMASTREALTLVYFDGESAVRLSLSEARLLRPPPNES